MTFFAKPFALLAGAGALGVALAAPNDASAGASSGLRCEIYQTHSGGSVVLKGVVYSSTAADGSYQFSVVKSGGGGSSNINQGGGFSVGAGGRSTVSTVSLAGEGSYSATLRVSADGITTSCKERTGGSL